MELISTELIAFLLAIRYKANSDSSYAPTSRKSMLKLMILLKEALENESNRKEVLCAITGLPIRSQKNLTQHYTSVLIDEFVNNKNYIRLIREIERLVEASSFNDSWKLFPTEELEADMPYL